MTRPVVAPVHHPRPGPTESASPAAAGSALAAFGDLLASLMTGATAGSGAAGSAPTPSAPDATAAATGAATATATAPGAAAAGPTTEATAVAPAATPVADASPAPAVDPSATGEVPGPATEVAGLAGDVTPAARDRGAAHASATGLAHRAIPAVPGHRVDGAAGTQRAVPAGPVQAGPPEAAPTPADASVAATSGEALPILVAAQPTKAAPATPATGADPADPVADGSATPADPATPAVPANPPAAPPRTRPGALDGRPLDLIGRVPTEPADEVHTTVAGIDAVTAGDDVDEPDPAAGRFEHLTGTAGLHRHRGPEQTEAAHQAAPPAPAAEPAPAETVARAVTELSHLGDGEHSARVELHPAELGHVTVDVRVHDGVVHVAVHAEQQSARDLLHHSMPDLRAALEQSGLSTGDLTFSLHTDAGHANAFGRPDGAPDGSRNPAGHRADRASGAIATSPRAAAHVLTDDAVDVLL